MESQSHGFKFEDIILDTIFDNEKVKSAIKFWKSKDYTAIFDIPEYSYLLKYQIEHGIIMDFTEEEYTDSLKLKVKLPLSIKSTKQSKSPNKKIEFGDIQRTIKNFSLYDVKEFSIIIIEYKQIEDVKRIVNVIVTNMDKNNEIVIDITKFAKSTYLNELEEFVPNIKRLNKGKIEAPVKKEYRKVLKTILNTQESLTGLIKIDSKTQRRVQCSIKKSLFISSQNKEDMNNTSILKEKLCVIPHEIKSSKRKFKKAA